MSKKPEAAPKKPDQNLKKAEPDSKKSDVTSKKTDPSLKKAGAAPKTSNLTARKPDAILKKLDATLTKSDAKKIDASAKKSDPAPKKALKTVVTKFDGSATKVPVVNDKSSESTVGEELQPLTDSEWSASESAYSADLLNVKKAKNKVTVFAAPEKFADLPALSVKSKRAVVSTTRCLKTKEVEKASSSRVKKLSLLIASVTKILREDPKKTHGVVVSVGMKISSDPIKTVNFF